MFVSPAKSSDTQKIGEPAVSEGKDFPTEDVLISTIYFYSGQNIGDITLTTGPHLSLDKGRSWNHMAWEMITTSGIDVDPTGKYVYCACGNGVLASSDGGMNWRLTGGWQITEVQDVAIGPDSPLTVWAAVAYGLFLTEDGGKTWTRPGDSQPFRYVDTVLPDRSNPDHILVGTEIGLFSSNDRGVTYQKIGPESPVRAIMQDVVDDQVWRIGTDGEGMWWSINLGRTWEKWERSENIINRIVQNPLHPDQLVCGVGHGVSISNDNGISWHTYTEGFGEFSPVYALAIDKDDSNRIYAGARDGYYVSDDGGKTWHTVLDSNGNAIMKNACISDFWQGKLYRGTGEPESSEPGSLVINKIPPAGEELRGQYEPGFEDRCLDAKNLIVSNGEKTLAGLEEGKHIDFFTAIALIREGKASDKLYDDIRATLANYGTSMFHSFPAITLYLYCRDYLPEDINELLRKNLVPHNIYRGDTENHWVMYYTALLLTAQTWPETPASEWYTHKTTQENYDEALGWLNEWFRITSTIGQGEFDTPHYFNQFINPMIVLYEFAEDPVLKRQAGMVVDLLLADMAEDSLWGRYCGGHSRMYDPHVVRGSSDQSTTYFYLYFGGVPLPDDFYGWLVSGLYGSYKCPQAIADIARRRDVPYVNTEVKRVRNCMRYAEVLNPPVYKYTFMTPDYALGSLQGGILQPIQQHTWDATWIGSAPNTTLFSLHPYYSAYELAMFFPEDPHMLTASVQSQKSTYTDPDKLCSSSPYERVFQYRDTLLAIYNIPEGTNQQHVTLYIPDVLERADSDGRIFGKDQNFFVTVLPSSQGETYPEPVKDFPPATRTRIPAGQLAIAVETGRSADDVDFESFTNEVTQKSVFIFTSTNDGPVVKYVNRHGDVLEYNWYDDSRILNGTSYEFPKDKFFDGPMMRSEVGSGVIRIIGDKEIRTLDFNNSTITEKSVD